MSIFFNKLIPKAWTYTVITPPAALAVSLDAVKTWLEIELTDTSKDAELTQMIKSATNIAQRITKRNFITTGLRTFRNTFSDLVPAWGHISPGINTTGLGINDREELELRRSPLQSVTVVEYLKDDVFTTVPTTVYYNTVQNDYSRLLTFEDQVWPINDVDNREQAVRIDFNVGYGIDDTFVPEDIKRALIMHVGLMFDGGLTTCESPPTSIPDLSRRVYQDYRIKEIGV